MKYTGYVDIDGIPLLEGDIVADKNNNQYEIVCQAKKFYLKKIYRSNLKYSLDTITLVNTAPVKKYNKLINLVL